ncbi:SLC46A1 [Mytilus edulis]|uniref:Proton-coupled folate transporter n=1 Tax=Mytilus edulis TaxID=6550 RepID=A0A8S3TM54_MYTED|nr:SLC46A1 [Mytilus edulis]
MEETKPLLKEHDKSFGSFGTQLRVVVYVMIYGCAFETSGQAEPQYIYAYLKSVTNSTDFKAANDSLQAQKACIINSTSASDDKIQGLTSNWSWYISLAQAGFALPVLMFVGPMADKIGRKPLILWNVLLVCISLALKTTIVYMNLHLYYYVVACGILGLSGNFYVFHLANIAILADCTSEGKERSFVLVVYEALLGLGTACSQVGTGYLIQLVGFSYPYLISSGLMLSLLILITITLKDPWKPQEITSTLRFREIPGQLFTLWKSSKQNSKHYVRFLILYFVVYCLYYLPMNGAFSIRTIYILGEPFCWTSEHIGWYNTITNCTVYILGGVVIKFLHVCCVRLKDDVISIFCMLSGVACFVLFGFSTDDSMIYIGTAVGLLRFLPISMIKAVLSRLVSKDKQGVLFSNVYLLEAVCSLGAATLFNNIYDQTLSIYNGLVFFVMAGVSTVAVLLLIFTSCTNTQHIRDEIIIEKPTIQSTEKTELLQ